MTRSPKRTMPAGYRLRVAEHLDDHWSPWFGDLSLTHEDDGTTSLTGVVADQAELHGLLTKIRDLGVTLISVAVIDPLGSVRHEPGSVDHPVGLGEHRTDEAGHPAGGRPTGRP